MTAPNGPRSPQPNWHGPKPQPGSNSYQHPYGYQQPPGYQHPPGYQPPPYGYQQQPRQGRDGTQYVRQQKPHSLTKNLIFGFLCLWINVVYISVSPNHYWTA